MNRYLLAAIFCCPGFLLAQTPPPGPIPVSPESIEAAQTAEIHRLVELNNQLIVVMEQEQALLKESESQRKAQADHIAQMEALIIADDKKIAEYNKHPHGRIDSGMDDPTPTPVPVSVLPVVTNPSPTPVGQVSDTDPTPTPKPKPLSALPPSLEPAPAGELTWRRILQVKGTDNQKTQVFHIFGNHWRVFWHNKDPAGDKYANTSALFIHAFPRDDTVPQEVCTKLGTGGDVTTLNGPGNFYLVVEAAGGVWEFAVEDYKDQP